MKEYLKPPGQDDATNLAGLRLYLFDLIADLNRLIDDIDAGVFDSVESGTANQIAQGLSEKTLTPKGNLNMNGHRLYNIPTPTGPKDAVTVEYVQQLLAGRK